MSARVMDDCPYFKKLASADFADFGIDNYVVSIPLALLTGKASQDQQARIDELDRNLRDTLPQLPGYLDAVTVLVDFAQEMHRQHHHGDLVLHFHQADVPTHDRTINKDRRPVIAFAAVGSLRPLGKPAVDGPILLQTSESLIVEPRQGRTNCMAVAYLPKPARLSANLPIR
jgi:hypothetical protein